MSKNPSRVVLITGCGAGIGRVTARDRLADYIVLKMFDAD